MLLGRSEELRRSSVLAEAALNGRGSVIFVSGPPGIGKTAFLEALSNAPAHPFRILRVTGHPDETTLPLAAVERLVSPLIDAIDKAPAPQQLALRAMLGIEGGPVAPLLLCMGVTTVLQIAASEKPLMVIVDDSHLLDQDSARVMSFLSRRIDSIPVLLVLAGTGGEGRFERAGEERIVLRPLDEAESLECLRQWSPSCPDDTARRIVEASGGLPGLLRGGLEARGFSRLDGEERATAEPGMPTVAPADPGPPLSARTTGRDSSLPDDVLASAEQALVQGDTGRCVHLLDQAETEIHGEARRRYLKLRAVHTLLSYSPGPAVGQLLSIAGKQSATEGDLSPDAINTAIAAAWLQGSPSILREAIRARDGLQRLPGSKSAAEDETGPVLFQILGAPWAAGRVAGWGSVELDGPWANTLLPFPPGSGSGASPESRHLSHYLNLLQRAVDGNEWGSIPVAAYWAACLECWFGHWASALDHAKLGLTSAARTGQDVLAGHLRSLLARLYALLGDIEKCTVEARSCIEEAGTRVTDSARLTARSALVFAALSQGRPEEVAALLPLAPEAVDDPAFSDPVFNLQCPIAMSDVIEAAYRTFDVPRAEQLLSTWRRLGQQDSSTEFLLARCEGLLEQDADGMERKFRIALALAHPNEFERGRTRLLYGERLRRARRMRAARRELSAAVEVFRSIGVKLWADRAQRELDASAVRPPSATQGWCALTAQERQVLRLAGSGMTNRQVSQALFLSPRTVGYHLYKAFPKLGISSRRQIREVMPAECQA